jgi:hydrogenase expression/formation protein HypD
MAEDKDATILTYPDMMRVPADGTSLEQKKAAGADIRPVGSALDVLRTALTLKNRRVIFLAVGFETTAPATAILAQEARKKKLKNLLIYCGHKTIPQALSVLGKDRDLAIDGFLLPGHVSVIIGVEGYRPILRSIRRPGVICGFEPLDILCAIYKIIIAVNKKAAVVENAYGRVVRKEGNLRAKRLLRDVFVQKDSLWRGLGVIPGSGYFLRPAYSALDAQRVYGLKEALAKKMGRDGCVCADVLKGKKIPAACVHFGKRCTPSSPLGPCMVSREGTCRSFYDYKI